MRLLALLASLASGSACAVASADGVAESGGAILERYCAGCHGPTRAESDFGFANDPARLVASGFVVPGDPDGSIVLRRIELGEMPPSGMPRPSSAEAAAVRRWIAGMPTLDRFRTESEIGSALAADAASLDPATRANSRWITLAQLANAGAPSSQLEAYRAALGILLASLSWSPAPHVMVAIDADRMLYRIDLRELGWSAATWDDLRARYPYGVAPAHGVPDSIRADWFVATASRGALYYAILGLPRTETELASTLGIDLAADIAAGRIVRAGFNNSGVSVNNRVIERHAIRGGAYWRSYDFASSVGIENVFAHPLDFVPAGGEIIFNLPDGMQAYMLVDRTGTRIDKASTAIVSDPRRPDRAVENAVSCIGCHASGINDRADQLREASSDARVRERHPPADELAKIYAADRARFVAALATFGVTPAADPGTEPVGLLAARYEAELDRRMVAAELGLRPDELAARLARSESARRELAAISIAGGTIKRDTWAGAFPRIVRDLEVGVPFTPRPQADEAPKRRPVATRSLPGCF